MCSIKELIVVWVAGLQCEHEKQRNSGIAQNTCMIHVAVRPVWCEALTMVMCTYFPSRDFLIECYWGIFRILHVCLDQFFFLHCLHPSFWSILIVLFSCCTLTLFTSIYFLFFYMLTWFNCFHQHKVSLPELFRCSLWCTTKGRKKMHKPESFMLELYLSTGGCVDCYTNGNF